MARQTLESRVESLERRVTTLEQLPARMDGLELQIVQLRAEMRDEFSATRGEMVAGNDETRRSLRDEIRAGDEETRRVLRDEIRDAHVMVVTTLMEQIDGARRETRVLFEETLSRIAAIQEGIDGRARRKKRG